MLDFIKVSVDESTVHKAYFYEFRFHKLGFSLVEILVALFIVSLAAVNISGLQIIVSEQNRDNSSHSALITFIAQKLEALKQSVMLQDVGSLNGTSSSFSSLGTTFSLNWSISPVSGTASSSTIRNVSIATTWVNASGDKQLFTTNKQVSFSLLAEGEGNERFPKVISNLLNTNKVNYPCTLR